MADLNLAGSPAFGIGPSEKDSYHIRAETLQKSCRVYKNLSAHLPARDEGSSPAIALESRGGVHPDQFTSLRANRAPGVRAVTFEIHGIAWVQGSET